MMWQLVFLGLALGANNAIASVALGATQMRRSHQLRTALVFAVFEAVMPILGVVLGEDLAGAMGQHAKLIGVFVLAIAGLYSLFKSKSDTEGPPRLGVQTVVLAIALSLDNLTVGFALGMVSVPLVLAATVFGLISLAMTLIGLEVGRFVGNRFTFSTDKLTGCILLLTATVMYFHH